MLEPVWAAAEKAMLVKFPAEDGRIKLARINCETDMALCKLHHIQAFPSIRVFRAGKDMLVVQTASLPCPHPHPPTSSAKRLHGLAKGLGGGWFLTPAAGCSTASTTTTRRTWATAPQTPS
jgi:hypothetical protein